MKTLMYVLLLSMLFGCTNPEANQKQAFLEDIGDGIYVHHGEHLDIDTGYQGDISNLSVVVGSKGVAVIDTGGSFKVGAQLREAISVITDLPVTHVINTHVHPDHIYGNAAFSNDKPAFVGHVNLGDVMLVREEAYKRLNDKFLGEDSEKSIIVVPTVQVEDTHSIDLGDRQLMLTAHPVSHTNTDVTIIDSKTKTLFTGDLLFTERTPVLEGDIKGMIKALTRLKALDVAQVVPGHGKQTKNWKTAIENEERYLNILLTDIRAGIEEDIGLLETMDKAAASEKDNWLLFDVANRRNINILYPALEWE